MSTRRVEASLKRTVYVYQTTGRHVQKDSHSQSIPTLHKHIEYPW